MNVDTQNREKITHLIDWLEVTRDYRTDLAADSQPPHAEVERLHRLEGTIVESIVQLRESG